MPKPDKYSHDVDWDILNRLRNIGLRFIKDNALERGPLKMVNMKRYKDDDVFKFHATTTHQQNLQNITGGKLPVVVHEYPTDTERNFWKQYNHKVGKGQLRHNGWIVPMKEEVWDEIGKCYRNEGPKQNTYYLNAQGFRHDGSLENMLTETGGAVYLGDSHVMGVGVDIENSWTHIAHHNCKATRDMRYINMGMPGKGIESQYRYLKRYIEEIKPDIVVSSYPWPFTRAEVWDYMQDEWGSITINKLGRTKLRGEERVPDVRWHLHTAASYNRYYKCIDAIKWLCHEVGAKFYSIEEETDDKVHNQLSMNYVHRINDKDWGRDMVHSGHMTHKHNSEVLSEIMERLFI